VFKDSADDEPPQLDQQHENEKAVHLSFHESKALAIFFY
jgi:hypothetical protein